MEDLGKDLIVFLSQVEIFLVLRVYYPLCFVHRWDNFITYIYEILCWWLKEKLILQLIHIMILYKFIFHLILRKL